ncbi:MAG: dockerin type I repeat-containing protein [Clostridia bacterium]|nr:dockerin type I repeat-containing protein [Clostridia bacterium]
MKTTGKTILQRLMAIALIFALLLLPLSASAKPSKAGDIWDGSIAEGFSGGSGDESDPYLISTAEELAFLADSVNRGALYEGKHFILTNDIFINDVSDFESWGSPNGAEGIIEPANTWTPIGNYDTFEWEGCAFNGIFDGAGHAIHGIYINRTSADNSSSWQGLFGLSEGGVIKNVGVVDSFIYGYYAIGAIVGQNDGGSVINCYSTGKVGSSYYYGGGIAGSNCNEAIVSGCYSTCDIDGAYTAGGVVGGNNIQSIVENCYSTGNVSGDGYTAGIVGSNDAEVSNCYSVGNVSDGFANGSAIGSNQGTLTGIYYLEGTFPGLNEYGVELSHAQMQQAESFYGFDFDNIWTMDGNPAYGYPELSANTHLHNDVGALPGDTNGDGIISAMDALLALRCAMSLETLDPEAFANADMDNDGDVTAFDALLILRAALADG